MAEWDSIYKSLKTTNLKYKTFRSKLDSRFLKFIKKNVFLKKSALDIGCGEGKYVRLLAELEFKVDAIDQSRAAVEMTRKALGSGFANITTASMFKWRFPSLKYDLVVSIATVGHGRKAEIKELVGKIYKSLIPGGKIFITLFDIDQARKEKRLVTYKKVADGTYAPRFGREKGVIHSFYNKKEARELFAKFKNIQIYAGGDCALYVTAVK